MKESIFLLLIILFVIVFVLWDVGNEESDIELWVKSRGEVVEKVDFRMVDVGPYIIPLKGYRYYYVKTDKNVYWFKFGWSVEIQQEFPNGQYKEVKHGK
jgi:hypothetical protein